MKLCLTYFFMLLLPVSFLASGQGTFMYDQQSANENTGGGGGLGIQAFQPIGQSFTPTFSYVGFIRLKLGDVNVGNGLGATLFVNLRANSIAGPILASTTPVFLQDGFGGYPDFFFSTPVAVVPGATYFFQPVVQSGDSWAVFVYNYGYPGGTAIEQGVVTPNIDLWFREGIVVPEPSSALLVLLGGGVVVWHHRKKQRTG